MKTAADVRWYVQSRGVPRLKDYTWLPDEPADREHRRRVRRRLGDLLGTLIDDREPCLALVRDDEVGLVVLATCLGPRQEAEKAKDSLGRPIRAALLGNATTRDGERDLVAVAAAVLAGTLAEGPVHGLPLEFPDTPAGFSVSTPDWAEQVAGYVADLDRETAAPASRTATAQGDLREDDAVSRERVAAELGGLLRLGRFQQIPGPVIVLRVPAISSGRLQRLSPWRTLTGLPLAPEEPDDGPMPPRFGPSLWSQLTSGPKFLLVGAGAVAVAAAAVVISLVATGPPAAPTALSTPSARPGASASTAPSPQSSSASPTQPPATSAPPPFFTWHQAGSAAAAKPGPLAADGMVLLATADGVSAFNATSGTAVWSRQTGPGTPLLAAGGLYLYAAGKAIDGLQIATGKPAAWSSLQTGIVTSLAPAAGGPIVYVTTADGTVQAWNIGTGRRAWIKSISGGEPSKAVLANGVLYVATNMGPLYALSASNGRKLWSYPADDPSPSSLAVTDGAIYFVTPDGYVYSHATGYGTYIWKDQLHAASLVASGGSVYVLGKDGHLYALTATKAVRWDRDLPKAPSSALVLNGGVLYLGTTDGTAYAISAAAGKPIWSRATGPAPLTLPAAVAGMVYFGGTDGSLYAAPAAHG
jgi:eukaryotic-like serine/threonine-protein kinase